MPKVPDIFYANKLKKEATHFANRDREGARKSAFGNIKLFQREINKGLDYAPILKDWFSGRRPRRGLALACGEMKGEYSFLRRFGAIDIDAYDIDEESRERFFKREVLPEGVSVNYRIHDVNKISLEAEQYDLIYIQHAYHHFEALEHVTDQLFKALKKDGLFVMNDYIGANFLQRTEKQRLAAGRIWEILDERYRKDQQGRIRKKIHIPDKNGLSPFKAIRSEEMLPIIQSRFKTKKLFGYGGIAFPVVNGFAHNYDEDSEPDRSILQMIWALDQITSETGAVEPNFCRAVFAKQ